MKLYLGICKVSFQLNDFKASVECNQSVDKENHLSNTPWVLKAIENPTLNL